MIINGWMTETVVNRCNKNIFKDLSVFSSKVLRFQHIFIPIFYQIFESKGQFWKTGAWNDKKTSLLHTYYSISLTFNLTYLMARMDPPFPLSSWVGIRCASLAHPTTRIPCAASIRHSCAPMPEDAPVTRATRPCQRSIELNRRKCIFSYTHKYFSVIVHPFFQQCTQFLNLCKYYDFSLFFKFI